MLCGNRPSCTSLSRYGRKPSPSPIVRQRHNHPPSSRIAVSTVVSVPDGHALGQKMPPSQMWCLGKWEDMGAEDEGCRRSPPPQLENGRLRYSIEMRRQTADAAWYVGQWIKENTRNRLHRGSPKLQTPKNMCSRHKSHYSPYGTWVLHQRS